MNIPQEEFNLSIRSLRMMVEVLQSINEEDWEKFDLAITQFKINCKPHSYNEVLATLKKIAGTQKVA